MFGKARRRRAEKTRQRRVCAPVSQPICGRFGRGKNLRTAQKAVYQTVVYLLSFVQKSVRGKGQTDGAKKIENCEFLADFWEPTSWSRRYDFSATFIKFYLRFRNEIFVQPTPVLAAFTLAAPAAAPAARLRLGGQPAPAIQLAPPASERMSGPPP